MKLVEKFAHVAGLRTQFRAGCADDGWIQAKSLRDVDSGGGSGHADFQLVGRLQSCLVEADRRVEHSRRVGSVEP